MFNDNFNNVDEIRFAFGGAAAPEFDDIDVGPAILPNSAPTATAPSAPTVNEDDTNVALADNIEVADSDSDDQTVSFTITGGTVTIGTTGITFGGSGKCKFYSCRYIISHQYRIGCSNFHPNS